MEAPQAPQPPQLQPARALLVEKLEHWYASPVFLGSAAVISFFMSIISVIPVYFDSVAEPNKYPLSTKIMLMSVFFVFLVLMLWSVYELKRNSDLKNQILYHNNIKKLLEDKIALLERGFSEDIKSRQEVLTARAARDQFTTEFFRDLSMITSRNSLFLYGLQNSILDRDINDIGSEVFLKSWDSQRHFMTTYCDAIAKYFTRMKGVQCKANIKLVSDANQQSISDVSQTEYGVDPTILGQHAVLYDTMARCSSSSADGRLIADYSDRRLISENYIFRDLYERQTKFFISNDIMADISKWNSAVQRMAAKPFLFPDAQTDQFYKSILCVPIYIEGTSLETKDTAILSKKFARFLGILSVDSQEKMEFDSLIDVNIMTQFSFDIVSVMYEYFRCVRHLKKRAEQNTHSTEKREITA